MDIFDHFDPSDDVREKAVDDDGNLNPGYVRVWLTLPLDHTDHGLRIAQLRYLAFALLHAVAFNVPHKEDQSWTFGRVEVDHQIGATSLDYCFTGDVVTMRSLLSNLVAGLKVPGHSKPAHDVLMVDIADEADRETLLAWGAKDQLSFTLLTRK